MSIATELEELNDDIIDAYTAVSAKGGTVPAQKNMDNLDTAIATIPSGGQFSGIPMEMAQTGTNAYTYKVANSITTFEIPNPPSGSYLYLGPKCLQGAFFGCTSLTTVTIRGVVDNASLSSAFEGCTNLSSLTMECGSFSSSGSTGMYRAFYGCTSLSSVTFTYLTAATTSLCMSYCFGGCTSLRTLSFPALDGNGMGFSQTNQFDNMLSGCSNVTVHFKSSMQSKIQNWTSTQNKFGGSSVTILYDL